MSHVRTQIREAMLALLTPMVTPTVVYAERRNTIDSALRPLVIISLGEDTQETGELTMGQPAYEVETVQQVVLELHAEAADGTSVADAIDQMDLEAEQLIAGDLFLGGLTEMIYPGGSELEMSTDQDRVIGVRTVTYLCTWRHVLGQPDTPEA